MNPTAPIALRAARRMNRVRAAKAVVAAGIAVAAISVPATVCRLSAIAEGDVIPSDIERRRAGMFLTLNWRNPDIADVSMVQLLATPERFHGKRVRFTGFVHLAFEGNGIYLHKEDFDHGIVHDRCGSTGRRGAR
jgi:hypothetical protein